MKLWCGALKNTLFCAVIVCLSLSVQAAQALNKPGANKRVQSHVLVKPSNPKAVTRPSSLRAGKAVKPQPVKRPPNKMAGWSKPAVLGAAAAAASVSSVPLGLAHTPHSEPHLSADAMAIADRVLKGHLSCELGAFVRVEADDARPGFFHLLGKGFRYHMHPVSTSTGAIRLEDTRAGAVWLQLANKSMLMDQKRGRRIADECAHPEQMAFAQNMKHNPPPKLFDTTGMGR